MLQPTVVNVEAVCAYQILVIFDNGKNFIICSEENKLPEEEKNNNLKEHIIKFGLTFEKE